MKTEEVNWKGGVKILSKEEWVKILKEESEILSIGIMDEMEYSAYLMDTFEQRDEREKEDLEEFYRFSCQLQLREVEEMLEAKETEEVDADEEGETKEETTDEGTDESEGEIKREEEVLNLFNQHKHEEALDVINKEKYSGLFSRGECLFNYGKYDEALDVFNEAIKLDPENYSTLQLKGKCLSNLDRHNEALDVFNEVIKFEPKDSDTLYLKGLCLFNLGKYDEALDVFNEAIEFASKNDYFYGHALQLKEKCLLHLNKNEETLDDFNKNNSIFNLIFNSKIRKIKKYKRMKEIELAKERQNRKMELIRKEKEEEYKLEKEEEMRRYRKLRKEIESMPQYNIWKNEVFEKFGRRCVICGSTKNIEIDHRFESFYSIVKRCNITNTIDAYECPDLWNVNNGAPLCKLHHDKTKSSLYYKQNN